jgi:hypothetical protein
MTRQLAYGSTLTVSTFGGRLKRVLYGLFAALIVSLVVGGGIWFLSVAVPWKTVNESATLISRFCEWLYLTDGSVGIRESIYLFPIIEGAHLLGIALSVGVLCWFDLRLLGLALRDEPVSKVWTMLMPWALGGFVLMFVSGLLLFWAEALTAYHSFHFWLKLSLILLAGVNALVFESSVRRNIAEWDRDAVPPMNARLAGALSLILWTAIIVTGRTMAYTF